MQVPDQSLSIQGNTATLHVENAAAIDDFQFFAPGGVPATISYDITWTAAGGVQQFRPQSSNPTDPTDFAAQFRPAVATITFSATESGFSVKGTSSSEGGFAEMGTERNGFFLRTP